MLRIIAFLLVALGITFSISNITSAQDFRIGIGPRISYPAGDFDKYTTPAVGVTIRTEYELFPKLIIGAGAGYIEYVGNEGYISSFTITNSQKLTSLLFHVKSIFLDNFYVLGELGLHFSDYNSKGENLNPFIPDEDRIHQELSFSIKDNYTSEALGIE